MPAKKNKIIYIGNNHVILEYLARRKDIEISAAYFQPRHAGTPLLVTICEIYGINYCCAKNSNEIYAGLSPREHAQLGICCNFERLTPEVFRHPKNGFINLHPSLLPAYKGRNPWFYMMQDNQKQGGVTIHKVTENIDGGPILFQKDFPIPFDASCETLKKMSDRAFMALLDVYLKDILAGKFTPLRNAPGSICPPIKTDQTFSWNDSAVKIYNLIRIQSHYGGCPVNYEGKTIRIIWAWLDICDKAKPQALPGTIVETGPGYFKAALSQGRFLRVTQWEPKDTIIKIGKTII